jgi:hypothetical protein
VKKLILPLLLLAIVIIHASCSKKHPFEYKQLILQPGPDAKDEGQDCLVAFRETDNDLYASSNHSGNPDVAAIRWTYNADNAGEGTNRTYIKFTRLSEIPSEAEIVAAKLSLYGVESGVAAPLEIHIIPDHPMRHMPIMHAGSNVLQETGVKERSLGTINLQQLKLTRHQYLQVLPSGILMYPISM